MKKIGFLLFALLLSGCRPSASVFTVKEKTMQTENVNTEMDAEEKETQETKEEPVAQKETEQAVIYVDICGAVGKPGVYKLPKNSRVFQAVEAAGGFREDAASWLVNQAEVLQDGQQICIYTKEEAETKEEQAAKNQQENGKVNLNQADKTALMTLTGIGETRAEAILSYRERVGGFSAPEELMQVEGIKEKTYDKIKDQITVD